MPYSVLIVDDSNFFQSRLKDIVNENPQLKVCGVASNGQEAVEMAAKLKPDVVSMDYEMPFLDGLSAVKIIMEQNPMPIIMFSSMTYEGARITLDALEAGAVDFMNKNFAEVSANSAVFKQKFHEKLITFARNAKGEPAPEPAPEPEAKTASRPSAISTLRRNQERQAAATPSAPSQPLARSVGGGLKGKVKLVAIGASTGGPVALADIISELPGNFPAPIVIIQHMPENFTKAFADRLNRQSQLNVKEAENGDRLERGSVLVAPGGKQMMIDRNGSTVKIIDGDDRVNYKPCVDITFASAASAFGGSVLGIVLTGMGSDGCDGAKLLSSKGATIWSQDKDSCVVYGMPAAVAKENLSNKVLPLKEFAGKLASEI